MRRLLHHLRRDERASAATELALITPLLLILMFGAAEMGNYFMNQHAVTKAVRDGARFAARLQLDNESYACPGSVWEDTEAVDKTTNVVQFGTVDDSGTGRFPAAFWDEGCAAGEDPITVTVRCVDPDAADLQGMYAGLVGDIPVVQVSAAVPYQPILSAIGVNLAGTCLRAESEAPVTGL